MSVVPTTKLVECLAWLRVHVHLSRTNSRRALDDREVQLRYHQYAMAVNQDSNRAGRDLWEHRAHLFHVLPVPGAPGTAEAPMVATPPVKSPRKQARISAKRVAVDLSGAPRRSAPAILTVDQDTKRKDAGSEFPVFVDIRRGESDGESVGGIEMTEYGLQLNSSAGDFAEWHAQLDPSEDLEEGDVVCINNGKVTRRFSAGSNMVGIVSQRAVVTGSRPFWSSDEKGAEIAYCGRVPVRCKGPVAEGDVLVASGSSDGLARVISHTCNRPGEDMNCSLLQKQGELAVGVAMSDLGDETGKYTPQSPPPLDSQGYICHMGLHLHQGSWRLWSHRKAWRRPGVPVHRRAVSVGLRLGSSRRRLS